MNFRALIPRRDRAACRPGMKPEPCVRCGISEIRHLVVSREWVAGYYSELHTESVTAVPFLAYCPPCLAWVGQAAHITLPVARPLSHNEAVLRAVRYARALLRTWARSDRSSRARYWGSSATANFRMVTREASR